MRTIKNLTIASIVCDGIYWFMYMSIVFELFYSYLLSRGNSSERNLLTYVIDVFSGRGNEYDVIGMMFIFPFLLALFVIVLILFAGFIMGIFKMIRNIKILVCIEREDYDFVIANTKFPIVADIFMLNVVTLVLDIVRRSEVNTFARFYRKREQ